MQRLPRLVSKMTTVRGLAYASLAIGALLIPMLASAPAQAQATRTWVSGVGDDANPCSRTAPCKTFAGAISKTAAAGEINVLDPGGFGALTITKAITVRSDHIEAGVLVAGTNGIVVNAASTDHVILEGLDFDGLNTGLNGVNIIGGGKVTIRNCAIRNFTQNGVNLVGIANARAYIIDSVIVNNAGGFNMQGASGVTNTAFIQNTFLDSNTNFATQVTGPSTLVLIGSALTGSPSSIITSGGGAVVSYGNNVLRNSGAPTQTLPLQ
jgi:hypothetical protein